MQKYRPKWFFCWQLPKRFKQRAKLFIQNIREGSSLKSILITGSNGFIGKI